MISNIECRGVYSAHSCHWYQFVGYLVMEDLPQELFIENLSINVKYLNNRTRETTVGVYLVSITTFRCFSI